MKKAFVIGLLFCCINISKAEDKTYASLMKQAIDMMDTAKTVKSFVTIAKKFEGISAKTSKKWLPYYYESLCFVWMSFADSSAGLVDFYLDKADEYALKAENIKKNESEILVLQAFISQARIRANPVMRGMSYGQKAFLLIEEAIKQNPENPRTYYLKGASMLFMPEKLGGGKKNATPLLEKSLQKYNTFKPKSPIHPTWGKDQVEDILKKIKERK